MNQRIIASPVGDLLLGAENGYLTQVRLYEAGKCTKAEDENDSVLDAAEEQLAQYFAGKLTEFALPLAMRGTDFERAVWQQLLEIPFGETISYGTLARRLGKPSAFRAVGGACSRNPLLIVVPCHRVVASSGKLTGFAGGMQAKRALLTLEGHWIENERIAE